MPIRGGPKELGGAGFYSFKNTIGASGVQHFIKNWRTPWEDIRKALRIAMSWTQYSAGGVLYPILSNTSQDLSYVKGRTILLSVRNHLQEYNGKIHLDTTYVQHPLRKKYVSIVDLVNTQTIHKVNINKK